MIQTLLNFMYCMFVRSATITKFAFTLLCMSVAAVLAVLPAQAAEPMTLVTETEVEDYQTLKAKVAYLTAYLTALQEGEATDTTFVMALNGNLVQVNGTIVRERDSKMMEICGPMVKGTINWGDGTTESLHGLGCSGDVHTFATYHAYAAPGSYTITVSGGAGRDERSVVAAGRAGTDVTKLLEAELDGMALEVTGVVVLDDALPRTCEATQMATIFWGDGNSEAVTTDCSTMAYSLTYEYPRPGTYKVLVIDTDGDAAQQLVTVNGK